MMRYYSSTAGEMTLTAGVAAGDSSVQLDTVVGLPVSYPFTLFLDYGGVSEEIVEVTSGSGTTLTVTRGVDGTSGQAHSLGAKVRHGVSARDLRESRQHEAATAAHGVSGNVVGTTDVQTLTNKALTAPDVADASLSGTTAASGEINTASDSGWTSGSSGTKRVTLAAGATTNGSALEALTEPAYTSGGPVTHGVTVRTANNAVLGSGKALRVIRHDSSWAGAATEVASIDKDGAIVSPTITSLQSADTALQSADAALDTRLDAIESNLGSQTTFAATSAAKDGKRIHWGTATIDTDANGFATVTHGAGFTPSVVDVSLDRNTGALYVNYGVALKTSTTFQARALDGSGTPAANVTGIPIQFVCYE